MSKPRTPKKRADKYEKKVAINASFIEIAKAVATTKKKKT